MSQISQYILPVAIVLIVGYGAIKKVPVFDCFLEGAKDGLTTSAQILPALFGGLGVVFISKNWKIAVAPVLLMLVLFIFVPALNAGTVGIMVPVGVLFTLGVSRILYKKNLL